jgi:SAM-dependent methyltransferase
VLTVDFDRLGIEAGMRVLDLGCGQGRHAFEAARRGAHVVAVDREAADCKDIAAALAAEVSAQTVPQTRTCAEKSPSGGGVVNGDGVALPFADGAFDRVIAAEVLEHVEDDGAAMAELARVLRPGGRLAVTVPRWFPERVCWALAEEYHAPAVPGGHVRIYRRGQLIERLAAAGLRPLPTLTHHAHALHSPYWWLKCAVGVSNDEAAAVRLYHRFLVWDIFHPNRFVRGLERALNPVVGKSLVVYCERRAGVARTP